MVTEIAERIINKLLDNYSEYDREEEIDTIEEDVMDAYEHCMPQADEDLYPCRTGQRDF